MLDADASFFVYSRHYPLSCRGAVGYKTGVFPPKAGGVILIYDFLNTPTAMSLEQWRFYYAKNNSVFIVMFDRKTSLDSNIAGVWRGGEMCV